MSSPIHCTVDKLTSVGQLQLTLHHPHNSDLRGFTPLLAIDHTFPYKPIIKIQRKKEGEQQEERETIIDVPINVRVDLKDTRNHVAHNQDSTIISLRIKSGTRSHTHSTRTP